MISWVAGILLFPNPKLQRAAVDVRDVVRLALVLEHRDARNVESLGVRRAASLIGTPVKSPCTSPGTRSP